MGHAASLSSASPSVCCTVAVVDALSFALIVFFVAPHVMPLLVGFAHHRPPPPVSLLLNLSFSALLPGDLPVARNAYQV